ncbi:hypothetical protein B484DRAFT_445207 [Ochromonadaceae sp. CCMP2298]|nr:hypothetical protein B484DRAFT_445207 [Ochromonadaceae sp. CCMP2298]
MEQEKIFNLQLSIQRMEEELTLYRNGTTAEQMFELIKEKDSELEDVREKLADREAKLRKLAKTSSEVLARSEDLQQQKSVLEHQLEEVRRVVRVAELELVGVRKSQGEESGKVALAVSRCAEAEALLAAETDKARSLGEQLVENEQHISDLEGELLLKGEEAEEYLAELNAATLSNEDSLEKLALAEAEGEKLRGLLAEGDDSVQQLQMRCAALVGEKAKKLRELDRERQEMISQVQEFKKSMADSLVQRDETIARRNDKIKELKLQLAISQADGRLKAQRAEEALAERESYWAQQVQLTSVQGRLDETQRKVEAMEVQRKAWSDARAEHEATKGKLLALEEQLRERGGVGGRRALADKTNCVGDGADVGLAEAMGGAGVGGAGVSCSAAVRLSKQHSYAFSKADRERGAEREGSGARYDHQYPRFEPDV